LAIFLAPEFYPIPLNFAELVVVTDHFYLKPLVALLTSDKRFYVLALSQQDVRLIECSHSSVREIELEDVPKSLEETLQYDETAKEGQRRISTLKGEPIILFSKQAVFMGKEVLIEINPRREFFRFFTLLIKDYTNILKDKFSLLS
jgi:hypothetical protein